MTDDIKLDPEGVEKAIATVVSGGAFVPGILSRDDLETAIRAYISHVGEPVQKVHELGEQESARDIWEVTNQLVGYIDASIPDELARFLYIESVEAAKLAATIERLTRERDEARAEFAHLFGSAPLNESTGAIVEAVEYWINARFGGEASARQITSLVLEAIRRAEAAESELQHLREGK